MKAGLFPEIVTSARFPSTRYQGSKSKLADWIWASIEFLDFRSALDAFGGSGSIAHRLKQEGKQVTYNDYLRFNYFIGLALIENSGTHLQEKDVESIQLPKPHTDYKHFIEETFRGIYFYDEENRWLDTVVQNISSIRDKYKKALLYSALCQACIVKRPFNLFHRANLYLRSANVKRTFGNKTTWDKPFPEHFCRFAEEMSNAVFDNGATNKAVREDVFKVNTTADLVYLDPPYADTKGKSVDYREFYHFLEGVVDYASWPSKVEWKSKNLRLKPTPNIWNDPKKVEKAFADLFDKFRHSTIVVSYRSDGIPSVVELRTLLKRFKKHVLLRVYREYKYVLSPSHTDEILLIGY